MKTLVLMLESATPAVDQPASGMDERKVEQDVVYSLSHLASVHSYHASSFISLNKKYKLYKKRGIYLMKYSYVHRKRELSS
jgi:hypothetical protein